MERGELLTIKNLQVWYTRGKPVLSGFSIDLWKNEAVGLIGLNGAGKTTFLKTLSGLIGGFWAEQIRFCGAPCSFRDRDFRRNRYTVFDQDRSFAYFTFSEYLSYAASSYRVKLPDAAELVRGFHFEEYVNVLLKELSMGNRKKASLIAAFALRPKLLLLDEPVNGLDFESTEFLYRQIHDYRQFGTVLFSSHILESLCLTADRVLVLEQGRIRRGFTGQELKVDHMREVLADYETS